jgi:hypothetical protein
VAGTRTRSRSRGFRIIVVPGTARDPYKPGLIAVSSLLPFENNAKLVAPPLSVWQSGVNSGSRVTASRIEVRPTFSGRSSTTMVSQKSKV